MVKRLRLATHLGSKTVLSLKYFIAQKKRVTLTFFSFEKVVKTLRKNTTYFPVMQEEIRFI
jgi:hypothetical protein